jgi:hypothetical protein
MNPFPTWAHAAFASSGQRLNCVDSFGRFLLLDVSVRRLCVRSDSFAN